MIWRSMIGKLWATIIAIVTIVLLFLTLFLLQFFQNNNIQQAEQQMEKIGRKSAELVVHPQGRTMNETLSTVNDLADVYNAGYVLVLRNQEWRSASKTVTSGLHRAFFEQDATLKQALTGRKPVKKIGMFQVPKKHSSKRLLVVGVPVRNESGTYGAVYMVQSIQIAQNAIDQSKKLIFIAAGFSILLTTFFAFFLSTRIGSPLRKMRKAARQVALGNFDIKVPVVTRDEVGDLAVAFNHMREKLKENMNALRQEKEQLAGILQNMADGVLLMDTKAQIVAANPPAAHFIYSWNYEHKSIRSHAETPDPLKKLFHRIAEKNEQQTLELEVQGRIWVVILRPLYDQEKVRGSVAVLRDMTEERHNDQMIRSFVANVSHELRTPIAMMQGYSEAIIDDIAESVQDKKDMAQIIVDESKRMGRLVNELLDLAKLEAGHFQLDRHKVTLGDFFKHNITKFSKLASDTKIKIQSDLEGIGKTKFFMDPDRVEQVMTNLIDNAIRHTREGGFVTVKARIETDRLHVWITDSGVGIAKEDIPFVFERFYKADKARTRGKAGTGLGLAIAKHIVEAHGGEITVNSIKGEGTTFQFTLKRTLPVQS
ncbi:ATP-binding protein [Sporolactobacillus inulinus]|uniref:histidine kinase n=2 Tax=Sporolactobacillus inulinus TaxID=2078 RepID=A0A0U1QQF6_9BACL|nr:ATP-binding protein [Sporolactobacillus inulinus]KLI03041.1 histidine kinase [Sporolactobacillus inulinus CASD]GEB77109.1 sensor histidine kinase ResE [Sporolactobacillus inulinus]